MSNISDAISKATEAASTMTKEEANAPAVIDALPTSGGAVTYGKPSLAAASATKGVIPRSVPYLKVSEHGMKIGKDKKLVDGFKAKMLMVEDEGFMLKWTIKFGASPTVYLSTYDGVICDKGGLWTDAVMKANTVEPGSEAFLSVDAIIILDEDVKLKEETQPKGNKIAFNASKTNFSEFQEFSEAVSKAGLMGQMVDVKIGFNEINHGGNNWGVVTFELIT
jgi:hypothetical protein